jgi:hypothetical protein
MADDELARRKGPSCYSLPLSASLAQPGTNLQEMRQEMCGLSIGWVGWHPTLNRAALLRTEAADKRARNRPQKQTPRDRHKLPVPAFVRPGRCGSDENQDHRALLAGGMGTRQLEFRFGPGLGRSLARVG